MASKFLRKVAAMRIGTDEKGQGYQEHSCRMVQRKRVKSKVYGSHSYRLYTVFYGFYRALSRCPAKFGSDDKDQGFFSSHLIKLRNYWECLQTLRILYGGRIHIENRTAINLPLTERNRRGDGRRRMWQWGLDLDCELYRTDMLENILTGMCLNCILLILTLLLSLYYHFYLNYPFVVKLLHHSAFFIAW